MFHDMRTFAHCDLVVYTPDNPDQEEYVYVAKLELPDCKDPYYNLGCQIAEFSNDFAPMLKAKFGPNIQEMIRVVYVDFLDLFSYEDLDRSYLPNFVAKMKEWQADADDFSPRLTDTFTFKDV